MAAARQIVPLASPIGLATNPAGIARLPLMRLVVIAVMAALVAATVAWIGGLSLDVASSTLGAAITIAWGFVVTVWGVVGLFGSRR